MRGARRRQLRFGEGLIAEEVSDLGVLMAAG